MKGKKVAASIPKHTHTASMRITSNKKAMKTRPVSTYLCRFPLPPPPPPSAISSCLLLFLSRSSSTLGPFLEASTSSPSPSMMYYYGSIFSPPTRAIRRSVHTHTPLRPSHIATCHTNCFFPMEQGGGGRRRDRDREKESLNNAPAYVAERLRKAPPRGNLGPPPPHAKGATKRGGERRTQPF